MGFLGGFLFLVRGVWLLVLGTWEFREGLVLGRDGVKFRLVWRLVWKERGRKFVDINFFFR